MRPTRRDVLKMGGAAALAGTVSSTLPQTSPDPFDAAVAAAQAADVEADRLKAEIARLQAELDECRNPTPTARGLLGWTNVDARFGARRLYFRWNTRGNMASAARAEIANGRRPLVSLKPPTEDVAGCRLIVNDATTRNALAAALAGLPAGTDACLFHEPWDNMKPYVADFVRAFDVFASLLPVGVRPVVCLQGWLFNTLGAGGLAWVPSTAQAIAIDEYNWFGVRPVAWTPPAQVLEPSLKYLRADPRPKCVWETNSAEDPNQPGRKAQWLRDMATLVEQERIEQLVFWDDVAGAGTSYNRFYLKSSAAAIEALSELVARPYFARS